LSAERQAALNALAESVADGAAVDWSSFESRADARERRLIRHLRLVDSISALYRSIPEPADTIRDARSAPAAANAAAEPADLRWGRLVLRERIGQGMSAEVFRAFDTELHREVALKLLHGQEASAGGAHARMLEEARRLARVRHPHVVQVYGAEQHDSRVGLWMELIRGESLEEIVKGRGPFGPREASLIGQDLCAAIAAVHRAGLLHRDVKAQNVIRESGGRIVLMDFGTGEERLTPAAPRMVGTPMYLAPELFRGAAASVQTDLYSLGVLLFYLVTGEFPVIATTMAQLARARVNRQMRRLRDVRPDLPAPFVRAVERALEHDPAARYQSAGDMEASLREAADGFQRPVADVEVATAVTTNRSRPRPYAIAAIAAALIIVVGLIVWSARMLRLPAGGSARITSIAVLPLENVSGSETPQPFADGLTDELIGTLGQVSALRVTSRTSVMQFKGSRRSLREIASALSVDALLEGTVAAAPPGSGATPRVRVNIRLITAGADTAILSRSFERPLGDTLALQSEIARSVVQAVHAALTPQESNRLARSGQTNAAAESAFFQGRVHIAQYGPNAARLALEAFQRATELDPKHAPSYAGMARAYVSLGFNGEITQPSARTSALAAVQTALSLDENLADAHAALADLKFYYDWDWTGAEREYRNAVDLNPSFSYAKRQYASFLAAAGRLPEAVAQAAEAANLDPLSGEAAITHSLVLYYNRDFVSAETVLRSALQLEPSSAAGWIVLARVYEAQRRFDAALDSVGRAAQLVNGGGPPLRIQTLYLEAYAGRKEAARQRLTALQREAESRKVRVAPEYLAFASLALDEHDKAIDYFQEAIDQRGPAVLWLRVDPRVDPIRSHPRFGELLRQLGVQEPPRTP
jgi:eukaryotic-like serine/threonine-protein kinase